MSDTKKLRVNPRDRRGRVQMKPRKGGVVFVENKDEDDKTKKALKKTGGK